MSVLEKVFVGRLKRFVIDEAHCCSQLGHGMSGTLPRADRADFRPDYKKLSVLKTLFARVPIQAVVRRCLGQRWLVSPR